MGRYCATGRLSLFKVEEENTEIENLKQSVSELKQLVQTLAEKK